MLTALKTILIKRQALVVVILYAGIFTACGVNLFSDKDDVELGRQLDQEIRSNPQEYPILKNRPEVKAYVLRIVNKVLQSPEVKKRNVYPYQTEIIADDKTVNAFCTPGGYIYIYTGLIKFLDNEASLAGVIGHEIAHAERRHATKRITAAYGVQALLALVLGENPGMVEQIAANLFTNLGFLKNSRDDEMEADNYGMMYLRTTEYYPGAIIYFFNKIQTKSGNPPSSLEKLFLTHPPSEERANNVNNKMREWNVAPPRESNLFADRYSDFKKKLP
jgi:predicted Zn-dependent protease